MALTGAYGLPFDPRPSLAEIEAGRDTDDLWQQFWGDVYHQGDVGTASYAAVPILAGIAAGQPNHPRLGDCFTMVTMIEQARAAGPPMPGWLEEPYAKAWETLLQTALRILAATSDADLAASALAVVAVQKGLRALASLSLMTEEERMHLQGAL